VTIVFFEENEQNNAQARTSEAPSQEERNQGVGCGFEKSPKDDCRGVSHGRLHGEAVQAGDIQRDGGRLVGASIKMEFTGSSSGIQHAREPSGGVVKGDVAEEDEHWDQYACLIVEEPPDQDDNN